MSRYHSSLTWTASPREAEFSTLQLETEFFKSVEP